MPELAPDLDLRPGEPARSTLPRWIATCRQCHASAPRLAELGGATRNVVEAPEYRALRGNAPGQAALRWATICDGVGDSGEAASATLQAAWAADDAHDDTVARARRTRAARQWPASTSQDALVLIDILRRSGDLVSAQARIDQSERNELNEVDAAVVRYQAELVRLGDTGRHLISSALRPPVQRPHATHGRELGSRTNAASGLLRRLFRL